MLKPDEKVSEDRVERAVLRERCTHRPLVLHADNGSPT
jgi:hypothetical protein